MFPGGSRSGLGPGERAVAADRPGADPTYAIKYRTRATCCLRLVEDLDGLSLRLFKLVLGVETKPHIGPDEGQLEQVGSDPSLGLGVDVPVFRLEQEFPLLPDGTDIADQR